MPKYTTEQLVTLSKSELVQKPQLSYEIVIPPLEKLISSVSPTAGVAAPKPIELLPVDAEASDDETHLNELANRYLLQHGNVNKTKKADAASVSTKLVVSQGSSGQHDIAINSVIQGGVAPAAGTHNTVTVESVAGKDESNVAIDNNEDEEGWETVKTKQQHHKGRRGRKSTGTHSHDQVRQFHINSKNWRSSGGAKETNLAEEAV